MGTFRPLDDIPTWRRLALSAWGAPGDPSVYGSIDVEATNVLAYIAEVRARTGLKLTLTHVMARAAGIILDEHPEVNVVVRLGRLCQREARDVTVVVALGGGKNLTSVKVRDVDKKSIVAIGRELTRRVDQVRAQGEDGFDRLMRKIPAILLRPLLRIIQFFTVYLGISLPRLGMSNDLYGSAMITNVGTFGLHQAWAALIPMARTAIVVTLGAIQDKPVAREGAVVVRPMFVLGGTFDHRILDGSHIATLAMRAKEILEDPVKWIGLPEASEGDDEDAIEDGVNGGDQG